MNAAGDTSHPVDDPVEGPDKDDRHLRVDGEEIVADPQDLYPESEGLEEASESEGESESDEEEDAAAGGAPTGAARVKEELHQQQSPALGQNQRTKAITTNDSTVKANPANIANATNNNIIVGQEFAGPTALLVATTSRQAIDGAAKAWIARYEDTSKLKLDAVAEMATFMIQIAGITCMAVSAADIAGEGMEVLATRLELHVKDKGLEPVSTGRGGKAVRDAYKEILDRVIREMGKRDDGGDFAMVETLVNLSVALSTTKIRELRRVAVMTAAQVSMSLLYVAAEKHVVRESVLKQMEGKNGNKKGGKSGQALQAQLDGCGRLLQEIMSFSDIIFSSVFTNRFRDVDAEIRSTVVGSLGAWMRLYPSKFLSGTYVKYLGWALSDKDGSVRYAAVNAVRSVYAKEENALQLEDFTNRFADRMEELMEDKEDYVAVAGTELVTLLVQKGVMGTSRARNVFNLLSDPSERLRVAAAELAAGMVKNIGKDFVESRGEEVTAEICSTSGAGAGVAKKGGRQAKKAKTSKKGTLSSNEFEIAGVLSTLRSLAEARGHPDEPLPEQIVHFVISSLSHKLESLSDWALMVDWLKREVPSVLFAPNGGRNAANDTNAAMRDLAMTFLCAIKAAVTLPSSRAQQTKERKKLQTKAKQNVTLLLQNELDSLINKFQWDPMMGATLVRTVPLMMVDLYSLKKQDARFIKLMEIIRDVMFRHANHECVLACSRSLAFCTRTGKVNTKDIARAVFSKAGDQALCDLQAAVKLVGSKSNDQNGGISAMTTAYIESGGVEESQELFTMKRALTHVSCILETHPVSFGDLQVNLRTNLREILTVAAEGTRFPPKVVFDAARSLFLLVIADVYLVDKDDPNSEKTAIALSNIKDAVSDLSCALQAIVLTATGCGWSDVAAVAAASLTDVFTVFNAETLPDHLKDLGYTPLDEDIDVFWNGMEAAVCEPALLSALDEGGTDGSDGQPAPSAVELISRVCCSLGIRQYKQLGAKLLSYWDNPKAPSDSAGTFRELVKKLKVIDPHCLTDVYVGAMRFCYHRYCEEVRAHPEEQRAETAEVAIQPFLKLSQKIAGSQAALNATSTLALVAEKAALWALEETPKNLEFLQGASFFVVKVKGPDAASMLDKLVTAGLEAGAPPDSGGDLGDWELFYEYCDVLKAQVQKSKGGVLKKANKSTPKSSGKQKRRISFAMADEGDFEARVDTSTARERRRSRRESGSHNYKETQSDEVRADDDDIVEF